MPGFIKLMFILEDNILYHNTLILKYIQRTDAFCTYLIYLETKLLFLHALFSPVPLPGALINYSTPRCQHNGVTMHFSPPHVRCSEEAFNSSNFYSGSCMARLLVSDMSDRRKILCLHKYGQKCSSLKCKIVKDVILHSNFDYNNSFN